jgi:hypothetical protein
LLSLLPSPSPLPSLLVPSFLLLPLLVDCCLLGRNAAGTTIVLAAIIVLAVVVVVTVFVAVSATISSAANLGWLLSVTPAIAVAANAFIAAAAATATAATATTAATVAVAVTHHHHCRRYCPHCRHGYCHLTALEHWKSKLNPAYVGGLIFRQIMDGG